MWGLCEGSDGTPYRTVVDVADASGPAYKCSCPSRKVPCKHALGLLRLWAGEGSGEESGKEGAVPRGRPPEWARRWIAQRRGPAGRERPAKASGAACPPGGPQAARRGADRRAERITAGATELEQRLSDLLREGLAGARQAGYGLWEETAARMVDAQAPGLAARVREVAAVPSSGSGWPARLLEECALLHLLGRGWLHREELPDGLAATVRSRIGLPASPDGPPVRDHWLVLARYDTADSRLTTRRIWLYGTGTERTALLLSYGAAGRAPDLALPVGLAVEAEVSAYPGSGQGRVALGERFAPPAHTAVRPSGLSTSQAAARYGKALRDDPWLDSVPVTLDRVVPVPDGDSWQLADADADTALPLTAAARGRPGLWRLVALSGGTPVKVFGELGHRGFTPLTAWPADEGAAVPLC
ncbi:hypothetical protein SUDANB6_02355 [Streptomyces sp. enrichment culture]